MDVKSVTLPEALRAKVAKEARRRNVSESTIVRESLERALAGATNGRSEVNCADLAGALVGSVHSGPRISRPINDSSPIQLSLKDAITASVVVDTAPIVASLDTDDRHHARVAAQFPRLRPPLLTCEVVFTEASFFIMAKQIELETTMRSRGGPKPS